MRTGGWREPVAARWAFSVSSRASIARPDRTASSPLAWKEGHDGVADELVDEPVVHADARLHLAEELVDEGEILLEGHLLREGGEAPDVGEKDGHQLLDLVAGLHVHEALLVQEAEEFVRNKAPAGGVDAPEVDMRADA